MRDYQQKSVGLGLHQQLGYFKMLSAMKILFFICIIVSMVSNIILDRIGVNRYDISFNPFRPRKYMKRLYRDALDKNEIGILFLFVIAMITTVFWIILFFVVF